MPVSVGDRAPDFELMGERDRETKTFHMYRLSEALKESPVVLHFFPAPFTSTCETQMCDVRDRVDAYKGEGVIVWGITGFPPAIIASWARQHHFGVPILADYDHRVSQDYVGLYSAEQFPNVAHTTKRAVVSVGRDGTVRHVWIPDESGVAPPYEEIEAAIGAAARRHPHPV
jgi:glutaredoxin-dependent peroxiredoxin